ncbi:PREDICTED: nuclear autoantigenic sperm protein isoform X4 [Poecilia mexicana]|uniref:Tetratricopeptide SHNi-TPR domain-containing protein n=1 Tax=Poecilia mexicana TaxID=48701 RepID=A0A3B3WUA5_9TELE|nr:PREDICTED: nuclear autoantigenic sperm protein isoform X4 [Poecilia mexicana]XP_016526367.1 PREDICTED: nuclear autoantigenic sperm protein isoform X5 [Poecilia formosa]
MPEETSTASGSGSAEEKPCSSTAAAETSGDVMEEAKKLIGTGKRHLVMGDVVSAVNVFQEACSMLAAKYGDTADECGEAFFLCGKSLLELARMENGVLGNALEGVPEESEEEEQPKNPNLESADNIDDDDDDDDEDEENNAQDNEEEDVGNLQLAWEMLEVAKVIFKRKESKDDQLMAAQAYLKLGEVSAETGNYPQALEDFQECLTLQLKLLPPHCRLLAETHYHVATTLVSMDQYNQAIQHYNSSVKVIETRLAMLQEVIDAAAGDDAAVEERNELEELKQLLPEIREKVEDAKESQRTASAASQAIQQTLGTPSTSSTFPCENGGPSSSTAFASTSQIPVKTSESASSSKAVSDISHLVRKKRKPEEESPVKDTDAKQLKQEATVNGSGDSSASNSSETQEGKSKESVTVESSS